MSLTIVLGPMFAGKTTWILNQVNRQKSMDILGLIVRPKISPRQPGESETFLSSHDLNGAPCVPWPSDCPLKGVTDGHSQKQVIVEEAQFTTGLVEFVSHELAKEKDILLVGLHGDYLQRPFRDCLSGQSEFLECIAQADDIIYLKSLCNVCRDGTPAHFTKRLTSDTDVVMVGSHDSQQAVCRKHL